MGGPCSGANIPRVIKEFIKGKSYKSRLYDKLTKNGNVSTEEVFQAYYEGDELARDFIDNYLARVYVAGLVNVISAYDPEIIVLGGSMALNNKDLFKGFIERYLRHYLAIPIKPARIEFTEFGDDVGIIARPPWP